MDLHYASADRQVKGENGRLPIKSHQDVSRFISHVNYGSCVEPFLGHEWFALTTLTEQVGASRHPSPNEHDLNGQDGEGGLVTIRSAACSAAAS